jgi:nitroreductase
LIREGREGARNCFVSFAAMMMDFDALLELIRRRRTIRQYVLKPVSREDITRVIEAARWAPSGANVQPCEYIVVTERAVLDKIDATLRERRTRRMMLRAAADHKYALPSKDAVADGSALIVVCADPRTMRAFPSSQREDILVAEPMHTYWASIGAAVENLHLAATALGLGIVWISVDPDMEHVLRELLDVPVELEIVFCCPIGEPLRQPPVPTRRPLKDILHWGRYERAQARDDAHVEQWLNVERVAGWRSR